MKKTILLLAVTLFFIGNMSAQWTDNPAVNTMIASGGTYYEDICISSHEASGNTFIQWLDLKDGRMNPSMQMINVNGEPLWGPDGILVNSNYNLDYAENFSMTATSDGGAVSHFNDRRNGGMPQPYAVKLDAQGNFVWGENGIQTFDMEYFITFTGVYADNNGGVWVTASDDTYAYIRHISADGTPGNEIRISDPEYSMFYPQAVVRPDDKVLVVYQKGQSAVSFNYNKELYVALYSVEGTLLNEPELLMGSVTMPDWLGYELIPDTQGGGYVIFWHQATGLYETYMSHFNTNGENTILSGQNIMVSQPDGYNYHYHAYGTVEPNSNELMVAWKEADRYDEVYNAIKINRIAENGEIVWDNAGITIIPTTENGISEVKIDVLPNGDGAVITYVIGGYSTPQLKAVGINANGGSLWQTNMSTTNHAKTFASHTAGFNNQQLILAWGEDRGQTGLYVQNIHPDGTMGEGPAPGPCYPPTDFAGTYLWNEETLSSGTMLTWTAAEETPLHYNIYRTNLSTQELIITEVASTETSYFDAVEMGSYKYQLTAVYDECESDFALTPDGDDSIIIEATVVAEHGAEVIVKALNVYNLAGQALRCDNLKDLNPGVYIIQGITANGAKVIQKIVVR